jgi:hypothetical protein
MGRVYKTAQGKAVDMDHMRLKNEDTIAVGNMKVNARGDQLGPGGQVIKGRNQVADQQYRITNTTSHQQRVHQVQETQRRAGAAAGSGQAQAQPVIPEVDPSGVPFDPPEEVSAEPQLRGSFADSIAKSVTVNQELLDPNMYKPKGPQRI